MRTCRICGIEQDESQFKPSKKHKDGLKTRCISCQKVKNKLRAEKKKATQSISE